MKENTSSLQKLRNKRIYNLETFFNALGEYKNVISADSSHPLNIKEENICPVYNDDIYLGYYYFDINSRLTDIINISNVKNPEVLFNELRNFIEENKYRRIASPDR